MIVIAGVALSNGDPKRLAAPFDPDGILKNIFLNLIILKQIKGN